VSRITPTGAKFEPITPEQVAEADALLDQFIQGNVATIKVEPNTEAWVHFDLDAPGSDPDGVHSFHFMDLSLLADELRQYGRTVQVLSPDELKQAVRKGFEKVASEHA
jgi:predicted DNA-binding transcriptional regulator YafY